MIRKMVAQIFSFLFKLSKIVQFVLFFFNICNTEGVAEMKNEIFIITNTTFAVAICKERTRVKAARQETEYKMESGKRKRVFKKKMSLQQHSSGVRHLLFYCNLMALLSPGATKQSALYHMAIISVALFCDLLTLSTVTRDP